MKRTGLSLFSILVALTVYTFADTNDFRVTAIAVESNDVRITWQGTGPSNYLLQTRSTVTGTWSTINNAFISTPTLTTTNLVEPNAATNTPARFYRVRISVPS